MFALEFCLLAPKQKTVLVNITRRSITEEFSQEFSPVTFVTTATRFPLALAGRRRSLGKPNPDVSSAESSLFGCEPWRLSLNMAYSFQRSVSCKVLGKLTVTWSRTSLTPGTLRAASAAASFCFSVATWPVRKTVPSLTETSTPLIARL